MASKAVLDGSGSRGFPAEDRPVPLCRCFCCDSGSAPRHLNTTDGGRSYYSFDYRGCHFAVLDSTTALRVEGSAQQQLEWLAGDLQAAKGARHVFVFAHHPMWAEGETQAMWKQLATMLA